MRNKTQSFKFYECYESASIVEAAATNIESFDEVFWEKPTILRLCKFSKTSILHEYIFSILSVSARWEYHHNSDLYTSEDVERQTTILKTYGVVPHPFASGDGDGEIDYFYRWFQLQEDKFIELWEKLTDEVFHLLFSNRTFLLQFNKSLAEYLRNGKVVIPAEFLNKRDVIKRCYIPTWAKKAVYYRDHGRCVLCQKDLSGLLSTDRNLHHDHIVPLKLFGVNDPCNLQLLCEQCNLEKSGVSAATGIRYPIWW